MQPLSRSVIYMFAPSLSALYFGQCRGANVIGFGTAIIVGNGDDDHMIFDV